MLIKCAVKVYVIYDNKLNFNQFLVLITTFSNYMGARLNIKI